MNNKRIFLIIVFITLLMILTSCQEKQDDKVDKISEDKGETIHMDRKDNSLPDEFTESVAKVNGDKIYLTESDIMELEGFINSYKNNFNELYNLREAEGYTKDELKEGIDKGFEVLYRSHIEESIKSKLCIDRMVKEGVLDKKEAKELSPEEMNKVSSSYIKEKFENIRVTENELDSYIEENQGDLVQYRVSYLEFTNGENIEKINLAIEKGHTLDDMKELFTYGDDIELEFDGEDILYRRYGIINYDTLYRRQDIKEKLYMVTDLEEKEYKVALSDDMTKYRLLKLEDKIVDPSFIIEDLEELYKKEVIIDEIDKLWDDAMIEILVGKGSLFD